MPTVEIDATVLQTLIDAAAKWRDELNEYIIPSAYETSAEDGDSYTRQEQQLNAAIASVTATPVERRVDPAEVHLIYRDRSGEEHQQPLSDLTTVGTLVDPRHRQRHGSHRRPHRGPPQLTGGNTP